MSIRLDNDVKKDPGLILLSLADASPLLDKRIRSGATAFLRVRPFIA
jgi:hypothetical protein